MRTLDITEIDLVGGGMRMSIGAHPLSTSIHHAKAHKKVHHAKAKPHQNKLTGHSASGVHPNEEAPPGEGDGGGDGDGGDGDGDGDGGDGDGGGEGDGGEGDGFLDGDGDGGYATGSEAGSNGDPAASASASGQTVTYTDADGSTNTITGNHPDRDNNPLDVRSGTFSDNNGAIGNDAGFAIFSSPQDGINAAAANMDRINASTYGGQATLAQIITTWSPPSENDTANMIATIPTNAGLSSSVHWSSLNTTQQSAFITAYGQREGWHPQ